MASRFDYIQYDAVAQKAQDEVKTIFKDIEKATDGWPSSRYKSLVLTSLEEAYMWVGKMIRDEQIARNNIPSTDRGLG